MKKSKHPATILSVRLWAQLFSFFRVLRGGGVFVVFASLAGCSSIPELELPRPIQEAPSLSTAVSWCANYSLIRDEPRHSTDQTKRASAEYFVPPLRCLESIVAESPWRRAFFDDDELVQFFRSYSAFVDESLRKKQDVNIGPLVESLRFAFKRLSLEVSFRPRQSPDTLPVSVKEYLPQYAAVFFTVPHKKHPLTPDKQDIVDLENLLRSLEENSASQEFSELKERLRTKIEQLRKTKAPVRRER